MATINIKPSTIGKVTLKPMSLLPGQTFNFQNGLNTEIVITTQGKDIQIKKAD